MCSSLCAVVTGELALLSHSTVLFLLTYNLHSVTPNIINMFNKKAITVGTWERLSAHTESDDFVPCVAVICPIDSHLWRVRKAKIMFRLKRTSPTYEQSHRSHLLSMWFADCERAVWVCVFWAVLAYSICSICAYKDTKVHGDISNMAWSINYMTYTIWSHSCKATITEQLVKGQSEEEKTAPHAVTLSVTSL